MRQIKFRAWDKKSKTWLPAFGNISLSGRLISIQTGGDRTNYYPNENIELMQYTGLKDKNGKEIYEGDVVRWLTPLNTPHLQVKWRSQSIAFVTLTGKDKWIEKNEREVIGNIYENFEQLEDK